MFKQEEDQLIPENLDFDSIDSLSSEVRTKLKLHRPASVRAAKRTPGTTPAALIASLVHVKSKSAQ